MHFNLWCRFLLASWNDLCVCHSFNIAEKHCNWSVIQPLTSTHFYRKQKLMITSLLVSLAVISGMPSLVFLSTSNCIGTLLKELCSKRHAAEDIKTMVQHVFSRHSVRVRTTRPPRFSSASSFFPEYKSNWQRYHALLAQEFQNLKPHFMGFFLTYCLILEHPLNFTMSSSTLWVASFDIHQKKLLWKWEICGLCFQLLSLLSASVLLEMCHFSRMSLHIFKKNLYLIFMNI